MRDRALIWAIFMLVACWAIACGASQQTRITASVTEAAPPASHHQFEPGEIDSSATSASLADLLGPIATHQATRSPRLSTTTPGRVRLPKPGAVSAQASAATGVSANMAYYGISALEAGANLMVGAGSLFAGAVEAAPQVLEALLIRLSSFISLHQLLRHSALPTPRVEGATQSYELVYEGHQVLIDWTLVRRHPQGDVWRLEVSGANPYRILGLVRSTETNTVSYRIALFGSPRATPGGAQDQDECVACLYEPIAPPGHIQFSGTEVRGAEMKVEFGSPPSGRYIDVEGPDPLDDPLQIPQPSLARETICHLGGVPALRVTTRHDVEPLRLTYLCGYGPPELVRIEQLGPDGRLRLSLSTK